MDPTHGQRIMLPTAASIGSLHTHPGGSTSNEDTNAAPSAPNLADPLAWGARTARCWRAIYVSHFLRTWAERAWEFAVGLILLDVVPDTLWLVGTYGLLENLVVVMLGPYIGLWLDRTPSHLQGALVMFQWQNLCNVLSSGLAFLATSGWLSLPGPGPQYALVAGMIVASCMAKLASAGASLSVERKWVKVLCESEPTQKMANVNSAMRRLDLLCLLAAPIMTGALMTLLDVSTATLALTSWSLATWLPQVFLLRYAANASVHCDALKGTLHSARSAPLDESEQQQEEPQDSSTEIDDRAAGPEEAVLRRASPLQVYAEQPVALAGISLAMLYFSVLSLGIIMTAYLKWGGSTELELSVFRGMGAGFSVLSTLTFPLMNKWAGSQTVGLLGSVFQLSCLGAVTALLFVMREDMPGSGMLMWVMLFFLMLSRWGLWTFDLADTQQMQEQVPADLIGVVNGVQGSLQSAFEFGIALLTIFVSQPQRFIWLAVASVAQVGLAFAVYVSHVIVMGRRTSHAVSAGYQAIPDGSSQ